MIKGDSKFLFNTIAPIYGLFYYKQRKKFAEVLSNLKSKLDLTSYETILDVGCGTGALSSVLNENGLSVTGIDPAEKMLEVAMKKPESKGITFFRANVLERLPFEDKCFNISIASYVAHGMTRDNRNLLYAEMSRVTKAKVIIYDYNQNRSLLTSLIEWLEGGDYFYFIKNAESEMKNCILGEKACFSDVKVINEGIRAAWYICTPN